MEAQQLAGTYTYRSFFDRPEPVDDFNRLRFAQLELRLSVQADGIISGALVFPAASGAEPQAMDVKGHVSADSPDRFSFAGRAARGRRSRTSTTSTTGCCCGVGRRASVSARP